MTSNDQAWEAIFGALQIHDHLQTNSYFLISAKQINDIGRREARLMAKFDTKEALPRLFRDGSLNINAVSNGNYIIFKDPQHKSFIILPDYTTITPVKISPAADFPLETLVFSARMSESNSIDFAHHAGILSAYSGESGLRLTTRGRFFSDFFSFALPHAGNIDVKGVQIEVDAGYEGKEQFLIIEAKASTRSSFNIRQLYYPFRHFEHKTKKRIRTILLSFSNGIYYFTEIAFSKDYYDYTITRNSAYEVVIGSNPEKLSFRDLLSQPVHIPIGIPVPQADDINKVIDLVGFLAENPADKFSIAGFFEFDERQGDYYANAGCYLGLIEKAGTFFTLTGSGQEIGKIKNRERRNMEVIKAISSTSLFNDLLTLYFNQEKRIDEQQIIERISREGLSGTTPARRKSTVKSWLNWVTGNLS